VSRRYYRVKFDASETFETFASVESIWKGCEGDMRGLNADFLVALPRNRLKAVKKAEG